MKVLIFGATGMVGQGVLRECLAAPDVSQVTVVGRTRVPQHHTRLQQLVRADLMDLGPIEEQLRGFDACFFCLGVSSSGMTEGAYKRATYELTLAVASTLSRLNPGMIFTYVSGAGTDSTERGRTMWARVKGKTENDLQALPLAGVYLFRPGVIQPLHGVKSRTPAYRLFYTFAKPLLPVARALFPDLVLTTEDMGRAMLNAARLGPGRAVLETRDIARLARGPGTFASGAG
ncbi:MAG TPA: NAD-dependent epimerase/dehydratase family protein [Gemmatimonadales bacterium]|jgi:uncharacterized protein YbjT (DUF2867 family)|nr:NAD-dependent epimerase/dehydratase family protein [Gemmatimonadales bacterium]